MLQKMPMDKIDNSPNSLIPKAHQLEVSMARFMNHRPLIEGDKNNTISELFEIEDLKEIMVPFYESTGLGVALFDENHQVLISEGWQKICTNFHQKHSKANLACIESKHYFKAHFEPNKAISYKCKNGLWDIAYPIYLDENLIGSILFGQFFFDDDEIQKKFFVEQAQKFNFDQHEYIAQLRNIPIIRRNKIESYVKLFVKIIEKTAKLGLL